MPVKQMVIFLCMFIFFISIIVLIAAIKNRKKNVCKYIIVLSVIDILFLVLDVEFLPLHLNLSIGLELLFYRAVLLLAIILFILSIIISGKKSKTSEIGEKSKKEIMMLLLFIIFPIILFCFSYVKEMYYIHNSQLILVCSSGENFSQEDYAYAINDDYCKEISIGTDFNGYEMARHLPKEFKELYYSWVTDTVEIDKNKIMIYTNGQLIYEGKLNDTISTCDVKRIFYK